MFVYGVVCEIAQMLLIAGKLAGHIECPWTFALTPTIMAVFTGAIAFIICAHMDDEIAKSDEGDTDK